MSTTPDGELAVDGERFQYVGINMWQAVWVAAHSMERLRRELDMLYAAGIRVLRITALSEGTFDAPLQAVPSLQPQPGVFDTNMAGALDLLMDELRARRMRAILVLNNMWTWSGGFATYLTWAHGSSANWREIPYPSSHLPGYWDAVPPSERPTKVRADWHEYQVWASRFYNSPRAIELAEGAIRWLLQRRNSMNGLLYAEDPTVMAWELCNEPRAVVSDAAERPAAQAAYLRWVKRTSALIKSLAPKQLVAVGSEGVTPFPEYINVDFAATHRIAEVDVVTIHIWPENWGWGDAKDAASYNAALEKSLDYLADHARRAASIRKPLILEEFGFARDGQAIDAGTSTHRRDAFYAAMLVAAAKLNVAGVMPWGWGGEGRPNPRTPAHYWRAGDDFIGDPPHEPQGWYSVFQTDTSTLNVLRQGMHAQELPPSPPWPPLPPLPPPLEPAPAPPPMCYSTHADDSPFAQCESWCSDSSHCAYCKCQTCPQLHCPRSCHPHEVDDSDVEKCESWCNAALTGHMVWCKCKACGFWQR